MRVEVQTWYVALANVAAPSTVELEELSLDERHRLATYLIPEPARIFATTRLALRRLLGSRLGCRSRDVRFGVGTHGKPFLVEASQLFFNVSHCRTGALIALSNAGPLGIDIEYKADLVFDPWIAASVCTPSELRWLVEHPDSRDEVFARLWCRKEAVVKAWGDGLTRPLPTVVVGIGVRAGLSGVVHAPEKVRVMWTDVALTRAEVGTVAVASVEASSIGVTLQPCLQ